MNRLLKPLLGIALTLAVGILFTPNASSEVVTFRKDIDNCRPISLTENVVTTLNGNPGRGCSFSVDVRAAGDWVMTGKYFDSPPYGWGGDNWFNINEREGATAAEAATRYFPYSFTCNQPNYTIDQSWLPSFVTLTSTTNLAGSGVSTPQGKRYTFKVGATAPVGTSFDIPLSFSTNCNMFVNKSGTILQAEPVDSTKGTCKDNVLVTLNPRGAQFDYTTTVSATSCLAATSTPIPTPTKTPAPTRTPTPTPPAVVTLTPTPGSSAGIPCPPGTQLLFTQPAGTIIGVGTSTALGGTVTDVTGPWAGPWIMENRDSTLLVYQNANMIINFPQPIYVDMMYIHDNDPAGKGGPGWSVNGVYVPETPSNTWAPPYYPNLTTSQIIFDHGVDSPHWNMCVLLASGGATPKPTPTPFSEPCPGGLLSNYSFESITGTDTPVSWSGIGHAKNTPSITSPDGINYGFSESTDASPMYQDIPVVPGDEFDLTFFSGSHAPSIQTVKMQYLNSSNALVGTVQTHTITNDVDITHDLGGPYALSLGIAPANATKLRVEVAANGVDWAKVDAMCLIKAGSTGPTIAPTPFHTACSAISCIAVAGAGVNACNPEGGFCKQTVTGTSASGTCPSACGTSTTNQSCTCSGPCCLGTFGKCKNGLMCGETKPVTCCTSTQPQDPTGLTITQPDGGTIIHTRFVKVNWNFPAGAPGCGSAWGHNCAGNGSTSFSIYIDDDDDFSSRIIDIDNIPSGTRTYTTTIADGILRNNTTYYAQVCANNYLASCTEVSFIKRDYPIGIISGSLGEFDNQSNGNEFSLTGIGSTTTNFDVNPITSSTGITTTCSTSTSGTPPKTNSYNCSIDLDNVNFDPLPVQPAIVAAIGFNPQLYTGPCFQTGATVCDSNTQLPIDYDTNGTSNPIINQNIYFTLNPGLTFMKIKNTSIISHGSLSTPFPVFTTLFDASGDDYNNDGNFLIIGNNSGSINGVGTGIFGSAPPLGTGLVSRKSTPPYPPGENWMAKNYFPVTPFNNQRFLEYVKTRKSYKSITNLNQLETDKVNVWTGSLPLKINNAAHFNSKNIVLVVAGVVDISANNFTPALPSSTAIIADRINFYDGAQMVDEAHGIFVGNIIDFGVSSDPLKITGNLASTTTAVNMSRVRLDNRKPSLFITFDVDQYMNLLPYMSTATYDWKQLQ